MPLYITALVWVACLSAAGAAGFRVAFWIMMERGGLDDTIVNSVEAGKAEGRIEGYERGYARAKKDGVDSFERGYAQARKDLMKTEGT